MRFKKIPGKQPCERGHGKTIHYVNHIKLGKKATTSVGFLAVIAKTTNQR
jgi:hypothetical protein